MRGRGGVAPSIPFLSSTNPHRNKTVQNNHKQGLCEKMFDLSSLPRTSAKTELKLMGFWYSTKHLAQLSHAWPLNSHYCCKAVDMVWDILTNGCSFQIFTHSNPCLHLYISLFGLKLQCSHLVDSFCMWIFTMYGHLVDCCFFALLYVNVHSQLSSRLFLYASCGNLLSLRCL